MPSPTFAIAALMVTAAAVGCRPGAQQQAASSGGGTAAPAVGHFEPEHRDEMDSEQTALEDKFRSMRRPIHDVLIAESENRTDHLFEAKLWLSDPSNQLPAATKLTREAATKLVDDLYAAGAVRVYVVGLSTSGDTATADGLSIVVDALDADKRRRVLQVRNDFYRNHLTTIGKPELVKAVQLTDDSQTLIPMKLNF